ncbi:ubl carboxyl-terminal hydrolase 18-like [Cetorhinus maximus]
MRRSSRHAESSSPGKSSRICERMEHTRDTRSSTPPARINQETSPGSRNPGNSIRRDCTPPSSVQRHLGNWHTTQGGYTDQLQSSERTNKEVPYIREAFSNLAISERSSSLKDSVKTSELNLHITPDIPKKDYTNQAWRSGVTNEGVPCRRVNKGPDFLNTDPSEKNPSSRYSVKTSELNVQAISDVSKRDYTNQAWRSGVTNEGVPCRRVNKGPDFLNTDPSEKNPSSRYSVKTSELNVQAISDVSKERKFKNDARLYSSGNTMQAHVTGCSNQNTNLNCEQRTYTRNYSHQMFVGLTNSGNSCCVNVLLQTLFMTPDYKVFLSKCQQKGILTKASYHIPYQLNKVFENLNSRTQRPVSPDNFIRCLMLNRINVGIQLDAEELFRSLFLLLLNQLKEPDFIGYVKYLHMVNTEECNRCLKCQHEFMQTGNMLTIPLSLYNPSSGECYKSIENSLKSFFKCQCLDGDNKSHCDKCGEKTATLQSYRVCSYPQILCLQLKRFDLAPDMRKAVKSNDFMEFQDELYSESFTEGHDSQRMSYYAENKWQYKLLSVIVHKGNTSFGHYYAYIRDFQEMNWYQFDDEHVLRATWEDVKKTFGSLNSSSLDQNEFHMEGTAYLLFYKRMD